MIARHGDRRIYPDGQPDAWMRNGTTGTITAIRPRRHDRRGRASRSPPPPATGCICGRSVFDRRAAASTSRYAVTSYAVQGQTREPVHLGDHRQHHVEAELYVDITRGRQSNMVYATRGVHSTDDDRDRWLPTLERQLVDDLANRLARGNGAPVAVADPIAATSPERPATYPRRPARRPRRRPRRARGRDRTGHRGNPGHRPTTPPAHDVLPDHTDRPTPATASRRLAADLAVHHATYNPTRRPPRTLCERILGSRPSNPEAAASWARLAEHSRHRRH